jgi:hypothetical protein
VDTTTLLLSLSQMALAIAGWYRLAWLFGASFGAMFLALLPIALTVVDMSAGLAVRIASGSLVAFTVIWYSILIGPTRRFLRETPAIFQLPVLYGLAAGHAASSVLQAAVALGAWPERADGIFACGIVWLLFHAAYQFSRILFVRPAE